MVATLQLEVAQRLNAAAGTELYGIFGLLLGLRYHARANFRIPATCFFPAPDVDSACVILERRGDPLLPTALHAPFRKIVKRGFSQRRKMMRKLLKQDWPEEKLSLRIWETWAFPASPRRGSQPGTIRAPGADYFRMNEEIFDIVNEYDQVIGRLPARKSMPRATNIGPSMCWSSTRAANSFCKSAPCSKTPFPGFGIPPPPATLTAARITRLAPSAKCGRKSAWFFPRRRAVSLRSMPAPPPARNSPGSIAWSRGPLHPSSPGNRTRRLVRARPHLRMDSAAPARFRQRLCFDLEEILCYWKSIMSRIISLSGSIIVVCGLLLSGQSLRSQSSENYYIYVSNERSDNVSVIDGATREVRPPSPWANGRAASTSARMAGRCMSPSAARRWNRLPSSMPMAIPFSKKATTMMTKIKTPTSPPMASRSLMWRNGK